MASVKAVPQKKSGRLLVVVRDNLKKEIAFEAWLFVTYPMYFDQDNLNSLRRALNKLEVRILRAAAREQKQKQLELV